MVIKGNAVICPCIDNGIFLVLEKDFHFAEYGIAFVDIVNAC